MRAKPVQAVSHSPATLKDTTNQPHPRRGSISLAPTSTASSSGTGGSNNAVSTGFQVSMPSRLIRLCKCVPWPQCGKSSL